MQQIDEEVGTSPASSTSQATLGGVASSKDSADTPQGSTSPPPVNGGSTTTPQNLRSCTTCRKRKVRCDKKHPCSNCTKTGSDCVFPGPGRAPRRARKPQDAELLARLRRLEGVVQSLGMGNEDGSIVQDEPEAEPAKAAVHENGKACPMSLQTESCLGIDTDDDDALDSGMIKEFGRLSVEGGRSQYVSNKFWVSLSEEVAEMRDLLDDPTNDEEDYHLPDGGSTSTTSTNHQAYIFNLRSTVLSLRSFHPPSNQIGIYWQIFKENVDPLIKIFHRPSTELLLAKASQDLDHVSKPMEVMMFTIYFAAITSMSDVECINLLGVEKPMMLENYRFAIEQAMARANFLSTQELVVLQSFTLFLTCVRRLDDSRYVWTLTGLVIRLAQSLGIHRDGKHFGLSPFETEMRRRLWWQICALDVRASEDHGSDFSIVEQSFDTRLPLNVNDEDIYPDMKEPPVEREGRTEMLFDLIRYSVSTTVRRLSYVPPGPGPCRTKNATITLEDKEHFIEELNQYLEKKYLRYCDRSVPLDWVSHTVFRLILAKMWLIVHHPFRRDDGGAGLPLETKDLLFRTSIEVIEFSYLLENEKSTRKWNWHFRTYVPWHAIAFVLSQLCIRTVGPDVEKAWAAVESVFEDWGGTGQSSKRGMLWKPLRKLMARARIVRARELQKQSNFPLDGSLGLNTNVMLLMKQNLDPNADPNMLIQTHSTDYQTYPYVPITTATSSYISPPTTDASTYIPPPTTVTQNFQQQAVTSALPLNNLSGDRGVMHPILPMNQAEGLYPLPDRSAAWSNEEAAMGVDGASWAGWDDWVKDFRTEVEDGQGVEKGSEGIINWF